MPPWRIVCSTAVSHLFEMQNAYYERQRAHALADDSPMTTATFIDCLYLGAFFAAISHGILRADRKATAEIGKYLWVLLYICSGMMIITGVAEIADAVAHHDSVTPRTVLCSAHGVFVNGAGN